MDVSRTNRSIERLNELVSWGYVPVVPARPDPDTTFLIDLENIDYTRNECYDGIDNDNDGFADFPFDPECDDYSGSSETGQGNANARFTILVDEGRVPMTVTFDPALSTYTGSENVQYKWDFDDDGNYDLISDSSSPVVYTYTQAHPQGGVGKTYTRRRARVADSYSILITVRDSLPDSCKIVDGDYTTNILCKMNAMTNNEQMSADDLQPVRIRNDVINVQGTWLHAGNSIEYDEYIAYTQGEVEQRIQSYLNQFDLNDFYGNIHFGY